MEFLSAAMMDTAAAASWAGAASARENCAPRPSVIILDAITVASILLAALLVRAPKTA